MKGILSLLLVFNISTVLAENTIIALVNNTTITYKSIESALLNASSNENKVNIINKRINDILQVERAKELGIEASHDDVNLALVEISESNNISLEQLKAYPEFLSLEDEVS